MPNPADSATLCQETNYIAPTETGVIGINFGPKLRSGVTLTGTPTVAISPSGPTVALAQLNAASTVISGRTCAANTVVLCTVTGATDGVDYTLTATCGTTGSPAGTLVVTADLRCRV